MADSIFDLDAFRSGKKPSQKFPKYETEVRAKLNLLDWQMKFNKDSPFDDRYTLDAINKITSEAIVEPKIIRRKRFIVDLNAKKIGRKIERANSLKKELFVVKDIPAPEMPVE